MSALAQQHRRLTFRKAFLILMVRAIYRRAGVPRCPGGKPIRTHDRRAALREAIAQKTERLYGYQPDVTAISP